MRDTARCTDCRDGWVYAQPWEAWLSRRDDAEAAWMAEHGSLLGFSAPGELLEAQPDADEDVECRSCGGTGLSVNIRRSRERNHRQARAA
jgi:hypothetical protein